MGAKQTKNTSTLAAWSTSKNNNISIIDLEKKQNYVNFDGARISDANQSWTHVKEIPNTKLIVSLQHNCAKLANLEILDISKKKRAKKIYSLGEVSGITGNGDVTYNARRKLLGAIPVTKRTAYHLFTVDDNASNAENIVKLNRKSKWPSQHRAEEGNYITGFDFNPTGESIATIDHYEICLISEVNTNNYRSQIDIGCTHWYDYDDRGSCRWSINTGEYLLFVKHNKNKFNILDVEKKVFILKLPIKLEAGGVMTVSENPHHLNKLLKEGNKSQTYCIDVCQSDGNLLALGGTDKNVKIFDKRQSDIVKTFEGVHSGYIHGVKWNSSGDLLATASSDKTVKLLDFKTGKVLHTRNISDENYATSVCFI